MNSTCQNPVLRGFHPDPTVCRVGELYVCATSTFAYCPGLPIHISTNLADWRLVAHAMPEAPGLAELGVGDGLYAPGLRHDGERFILTCTLVDRQKQRFRNFVVTATDAAGPWSPPIFLPESLGRIDPTPFIDDDALYVVLNDLPPERVPNGGNRTIKLWQLERKTFQPIGDATCLWDGAMKNASTPEAPRLFKRDGWYYLLIAEGGTGFSHAVTMARAKHIRGPYEACPFNPLLTHRHLGFDAPLACVGHADLVQAPDGSWWALALATRPRAGAAILNRETVLLPVCWHEGQWPVFAPGDGQVNLMTTHPGERASGPADRAPTWLGLRGLSRARHEHDALQLDARPSPLDAPTGVPAFAGRRLTEVTGQIAAHIHMQGEARGGLTLFADDRNHVRIETDHTSCRIITIEGGERRELPAVVAHELLGLRWADNGIFARIGESEYRAGDVALLGRAAFTGAVGAFFAHGESGSLTARHWSGENWG